MCVCNKRNFKRWSAYFIYLLYNTFYRAMKVFFRWQWNKLTIILCTWHFWQMIVLLLMLSIIINTILLDANKPTKAKQKLYASCSIYFFLCLYNAVLSHHLSVKINWLYSFNQLIHTPILEKQFIERSNRFFLSARIQ